MSTPNLPIPQGVPEWAWEAIGAKVEGTEWVIPERDAEGDVIGFSVRMADGSKSFRAGGKRGLTASWPLDAYAGSSSRDPVFVVEGASDTASGVALGLDIVGRPSAMGGAEHLKRLLKARHICLIAENDDNGAGKNGAVKIAQKLVPECASVRIITPPAGIKDLRAWMNAGATREVIEAALKVAETTTLDPVLPDGAPLIVNLATVKPESVEWLWPGRIAIGKLTLGVGDPGVGKSFVTLDMAARVSRGGAWPDLPGVTQTPGGVVLLSAEDDAADTIRPRLDAAGADFGVPGQLRIVSLTSVRQLQGKGRASSRMFDLSRDLVALETTIQSVSNCRLVVIDPVTAYLGGTDSHNNSDVRGLLAPLSAMAAKYRVAVFAITHLRKGDGPAMYRAMGSLGFVAAARAAWAIGRDPEDPDGRRRLFLPVKHNIGPDRGGLAFRLSMPSEGMPVVEWESTPVALTADVMLRGGTSESQENSTAFGEAKDWLRDVLSDGPQPAAEIKTRAKDDGIASRTLDRAKKALAVIATREGFGNKGRWVWTMPHSAPSKSIERQSDSMAQNGPVGAQCGEEAA